MIKGTSQLRVEDATTRGKPLTMLLDTLMDHSRSRQLARLSTLDLGSASLAGGGDGGFARHWPIQLLLLLSYHLTFIKPCPCKS
jgi:hypothetical protein